MNVWLPQSSLRRKVAQRTATRHRRVRAAIIGTAERPRLNVFRSLTNIYAQVIDDVAGRTLASASTIDKAIAQQVDGKNKTEARRSSGRCGGTRQGGGHQTVVFDRGGYRYHGRVAALAEGAREAGLNF